MNIDLGTIKCPLYVTDNKNKVVYKNKLFTSKSDNFSCFELDNGYKLFIFQNYEFLSRAFYNIDDLIGKSDKIKNIKRLISICALSDLPVIISGPSGTGKELAAHAIHTESKRKNNNFIAVNCASIPSELVESELFGYSPNSFTGASPKGYKGKFCEANGGTIFLDEIGDMPHSTQVKLLRVLQDGIIQHIGSSENIKINVRIIAATNKNIIELIKNNLFREDLFFRLNVFSIKMPALDERPEDIEPLIKYFVKKIRKKNPNFNKVSFSEKCISILKKYNWPGNVRELQNYVEREIWINNNINSEISHVPDYILNSIAIDDNFSNVKKTEVELLRKCLKKSNGNISKAAKLAGISRATFYRKLNKIREND